MIYLDNNATTRPAPEVVAAMLPYLGDLYANPSSAHGAGMAVKQALGQARGVVAGLIGAKAAEITFTASATEANHLAILGTLRARPERRHIVTTAVEHPSNLSLFRDLASSLSDLTENGSRIEIMFHYDDIPCSYVIFFQPLFIENCPKLLSPTGC